MQSIIHDGTLRTARYVYTLGDLCVEGVMPVGSGGQVERTSLDVVFEGIE